MFVTCESKCYTKGRNTVMGIATLLIMWFHSCISTKEGSLLWLQKSLSDIGVDMFLFASGVGVYFALKKYKRVLSFYFGRMLRVLIPFSIVAIPWFGYHDIIIGHSRRLFLKDVTMLTFWTEGRMTFWYVSAILVLYALTPLYMRCNRIFRRKSIPFDVIMIVSIYAAMIIVPMDVLRSAVGPAMIFVPRIPVYLMGLWFGKAIEEERTFRVPVAVPVGFMAVSMVTAAAAMGFFHWRLPTEFKYIAYGPASVILSFLCTKIPANKFCNYFGKRSLEIYLLLEKVQVTLGENPELNPLMNFSGIPFFALSFAVTLVLVEVVRCLAFSLRCCLQRKKLDKHPALQ